MDRSKTVAHLQFLGAQRIEIGSEIITPEAERLFAMIVRLSVPLGRMISRQTMMETLWPGVTELNARHNLRQTVYKARELGLLVEAGEGGLRLDPRYWSCDWESPVGDVPGEWLPHYEPIFSDAMAVWVTAQRLSVHAQIRPRIMRAMQTARSAGELPLADRYARQLLSIDTLNEEATLIRAESLAMQGAKVDALRLLDAYLDEIGRMNAGRDAALPAQLLRRRIAEKLPTVAYHRGAEHHGALVGRQSEMKRLTALLFDARAGRGSGLLLHGSEGMGVSRLVHEMRNSAVLQGMRVVSHVGERGPGLLAFALMRALVTRLLDAPGAMGVAPEAWQALLAWVGGTDAAPDDCPAAEIADLLESIADETPLLLIVEGAEHLDADSIGMLDHLYRRGVARHSALLLTTRTRETPADAPVALQWLERLSLRPMSTVDVRSVVTAYAAAAHPRATADQIACAAVFAEGVPMYGIEMLGLMLDAGSPDVVPWRVQVAVDRRLRELSETQWRVLALVRLLGRSARQAVVSEALKLEGAVLATALDGLESYGHLECEAGVLRVSPLVSEAATPRVRANVFRSDALRAAVSLWRTWKAERDAAEFFVALRACVVAGEESRAAQVLDREAGWLVRSETAQTILHELQGLGELAQSDRLAGLVRSIREQVARGAEGLRPPRDEQTPRPFPKSLPQSGKTSTETEHVFANAELFDRAIAEARNPNSPPSQRLADAVTAIVVADNLNCRERLDRAALVVEGLQNSPKIQRFDLVRAQLILSATSGDASEALKRADHLAAEARLVSDIRMACQGLRNAGDVHAAFGSPDAAERLVHESRELASLHGYDLQTAYADCDLAFYALDRLDTESSSAYLDSAEDISYRIGSATPLLRADIAMLRCWNAIVRGDAPRASKFARQQNSRSATTGDTHMALAVATSRLATSRGQWGPKTRRDFELVLGSIGSRLYYHNEKLAVAAVLLASTGLPEHDAAMEAYQRHSVTIRSRGQAVWGFLSSLVEQESAPPRPT